VYEPEFIAPQEERELIAAIGALELREARYKDYTAKRRTVSFGSTYDFSGNVRSSAPDPPEFLDSLRAKVSGWVRVPAAALKHILIAEYRPGTTLGWHRDVPDFELVCGVSLGASCRMRFRPFPSKRDGNTTDRKRVLSLDLAPRSAYVLRGDARWRWQHSIPPAKALRYSITLRTLA
jgi:alkylated DNA repair dioxygenase AlkB